MLGFFYHLIKNMYDKDTLTLIRRKQQPIKNKKKSY